MAVKDIAPDTVMFAPSELGKKRVSPNDPSGATVHCRISLVTLQVKTLVTVSGHMNTFPSGCNVTPHLTSGDTAGQNYIQHTFYLEHIILDK